MMNKYNFLLISILFTQLAIAQQGFDPCFRFVAKDSVKIHLDNAERPVTQDCAFFYRLAKVNPENLTIEGAFEDYYIANDAIATRATIIDGLLEGKAIVYYENGNKLMEGVYKNGKKVGIWKHWYENGKPYVTYSYEDNTAKILEYYTKRGKKKVENGNSKGKTITIKNHRHANIKGKLKNGLPDGQWTLSRITTNTIVFKEEYKNGRFIKGEGYPFGSPTLKKYTDTPYIKLDDGIEAARMKNIKECNSCTKHMARYTKLGYQSPEKDANFYEYLAKHFTTDNTKGYTLCSFVVTAKGTLKDITVDQSSAVIHDDTATLKMLIQQSGLWKARIIKDAMPKRGLNGISRKDINEPIPTVINFVIHYTEKGYLLYPETIATEAIQTKK